MKLFKPWYVLLLLLSASLLAGANAQPQRRPVRIFLEVKETNLEKPSTVATNTLAERLNSAGFRVTTNRREAVLVIDGAIGSRPTPVTDEVKREGGVNAEATASVQMRVGGEVIATSVERSAPGDWGVQAERVGEDRLIEVAGLVADDLFSDQVVQDIIGAGAKPSTESKPESRESRPVKPTRKPMAAKRGVSFLEVVALVQNFTPEDRIVGALRKYGIKFKPLEGALAQLRGLGASEAVITAIKTSNVS